MEKILVVEDEVKLANSIKDQLEESGFKVKVAYDGSMGQKIFAGDSFNMVILDINLPFVNGIDLCGIIREHDKNIPVLMLTALGELDDKIEAFQAGADDYLVKPFHFKELLARINVFLKRSNQNPVKETLKVGDLELDIFAKTVRRGGVNIDLSAKEFKLLEMLMRAQNKIFSKNELLKKVWGIDFDVSTNTVEVFINFLRNKIDKPFEKKLLHTKFGLGYYLSDPDDPQA